MTCVAVSQAHPKMSPIKDADSGGFQRQLAEILEVPKSLDSPVNLDIREATILKLPNLLWQNYEKPPKKMKITNTGQTVVLSGKWFSERPHLKGGPLSSRYVFSQIHFHWGGEPERGSEHTVDGFRMPLEMHLVHFKAEYGSQDNALLQDDGLFVIGCFFKEEDNPAMLGLTDNLGFINRPHTSHNVALCPVAALIAEFGGDYFSYWGSMCSDHCQHTILWCFPRTLVGISRNQMLQFHHLVNDEGWPLRLDEHAVKPLGSRRLFLVNPSVAKPSTTLPGMDLCSAKNSVQSMSSDESIESSKVTLEDKIFELQSLRPISGSALTLRSANQTTDLVIAKSPAISRTNSAREAGKVVAVDPNSLAPCLDYADTRGTVLTHPASGHENKDLRGARAGDAHSNDNLCERSDVLEVPRPLSITAKNVESNHDEKPMPKVGSSEEILRAIEEMRRNQSLLKDIDIDLDSPCPSTILSQDNNSKENISAEVPPPSPENSVQEVKRYKLQAPSLAYKTVGALSSIPKARPTATSAKVRQASKSRQQVSPVAKQPKDAPRQRSSPRQAPPVPTANDSTSEETKKPCPAMKSSRYNSIVSEGSVSTARERKEGSTYSQASSSRSPSVFGESNKSDFSDKTFMKSSTVGDRDLSDRGTFLEGDSPVQTPGSYISEQSSSNKSKPRQPKTQDVPTSSSTAKSSPGRFTVSLAGCWKKPSLTKMPVAKKEAPPKEVTIVPREAPAKCHVSPSDVRSVLEKLEREVSATLRHDKAGDSYLTQSSGGQEHEYGTLVQLADSLPSILGDQDSYASLTTLEDDDADNGVVSLYNRGQNFERKQLANVSDGRVSWRKKPSSHDNRMVQSDTDEESMNADELRAKRTNSLLKEATALLREHRRTVTDSYDTQIKLADTLSLAKFKRHL